MQLTLDQAVLLAHHLVDHERTHDADFFLRFWKPSNIEIRGFDSLEQAAEEAERRFNADGASNAAPTSDSAPPFGIARFGHGLVSLLKTHAETDTLDTLAPASAPVALLASQT